MTLSTYVKGKLYTEVWFDAQQHYNYVYIFIMLFIFHCGLKRMDHLQLDNDHWINCTNHNERITFQGMLQCHNIETSYTLNSSVRCTFHKNETKYTTHNNWNSIFNQLKLKRPTHRTTSISITFAYARFLYKFPFWMYFNDCFRPSFVLKCSKFNKNRHSKNYCYFLGKNSQEFFLNFFIPKMNMRNFLCKIHLKYT